MKKEDVVKIVIEGVASIALGIVADCIANKFKTKIKKANFENTMVADLTVAELKEIIKGEA